MPRRQVRRIYLAGPITGCNENQKKVWRDRIQRSWSPEFEFYCPVQRLDELSEKGVRITPYQVVNFWSLLAFFWPVGPIQHSS